MVTKGYQKGVYDRVTEGTWELSGLGNQARDAAIHLRAGQRIGRKGPRISARLGLGLALWIVYRGLRGTLSPCHGGQRKNHKDPEGWAFEVGAERQKPRRSSTGSPRGETANESVG